MPSADTPARSHGQVPVPFASLAAMFTMTVATWNINSVRRRLDLVLAFLDACRPDVLCLQEIKATEEVFPFEPLRDAGWPHIAMAGFKGYNGVATLSRLPFEASATESWCGRNDGRHVWTVLPGGIELHNFYVPAGGDVADPDVNEKFAHKLDFVRDMTTWFAARRRSGTPLVMVGDLNIAPLENDVWSHRQLLKVVSHTPVEVQAMNRLKASCDWVDAVRHFVPETEKLYSWWSYRARDWSASDRGRRLDHVWVTPELKPGLRSAAVHRHVRGWEGASDHCPVSVTLETGA